MEDDDQAMEMSRPGRGPPPPPPTVTIYELIDQSLRNQFDTSAVGPCRQWVTDLFPFCRAEISFSLRVNLYYNGEWVDPALHQFPPEHAPPPVKPKSLKKTGPFSEDQILKIQNTLLAQPELINKIVNLVNQRSSAAPGPEAALAAQVAPGEVSSQSDSPPASYPSSLPSAEAVPQDPPSPDLLPPAPMPPLVRQPQALEIPVIKKIKKPSRTLERNDPPKTRPPKHLPVTLRPPGEYGSNTLDRLPGPEPPSAGAPFWKGIQHSINSVARECLRRRMIPVSEIDLKKRLLDAVVSSCDYVSERQAPDVRKIQIRQGKTFCPQTVGPDKVDWGDISSQREMFNQSGLALAAGPQERVFAALPSKMKTPHYLMKKVFYFRKAKGAHLRYEEIDLSRKRLVEAPSGATVATDNPKAEQK